MPKIKHILFPVDFSERCYGAVSFVEGVAKRYGAKVTLFSVAQPVYAGGAAGVPLIDTEEMLRNLKTELDGAFAKDFANLPVDRVAALGDPAQLITEFAASHDIDLIAMPTHGYGPFRQLLLGSVTAKVLHDVHCPVWTTAHTGEAPDREHLDVKKIVCAVDTTEASLPLMQWAADYARDAGASIRFVHVVPGIEAWPERQLDAEFEEQVRLNARKAIEELETSAGLSVPICVATGTVADAVRDEAVQHQADLLIIGRGTMHERLGRLRTHAYGIIRHAPCPVISV
jgi:nucleotide-binding universal stress UspA family protein